MNYVGSAAVEISAFNFVPDFALGLVRDIRIRWACEEIGRPYKTRLIDGATDRPASYIAEQPFGQVPAFWDGDIHMFESGAILLHLGEEDERLLSAEPVRRAQTLSWLFAALSSVEPALMNIASIDFFLSGEPWVQQWRPAAESYASQRVKAVSDALGDSEWLAGGFSIADILMVSVFRNVRHTEIVTAFDNLAEYVKRAELRPALIKAVTSQAADCGKPPHPW